MSALLPMIAPFAGFAPLFGVAALGGLVLSILILWDFNRRLTPLIKIANLFEKSSKGTREQRAPEFSVELKARFDEAVDGMGGKPSKPSAKPAAKKPKVTKSHDPVASLGNRLVQAVAQTPPDGSATYGDTIARRVVSQLPAIEKVLGFLPAGFALKLTSVLPGIIVFTATLGSLVAVSGGTPLLTIRELSNVTRATAMAAQLTTQINLGLTMLVLGVVFGLVGFLASFTFSVETTVMGVVRKVGIGVQSLIELQTNPSESSPEVRKSVTMPQFEDPLESLEETPPPKPAGRDLAKATEARLENNQWVDDSEFEDSSWENEAKQGVVAKDEKAEAAQMPEADTDEMEQISADAKVESSSSDSAFDLDRPMSPTIERVVAEEKVELGEIPFVEPRAGENPEDFFKMNAMPDDWGKATPSENPSAPKESQTEDSGLWSTKLENTNVSVGNNDSDLWGDAKTGETKTNVTDNAEDRVAVLNHRLGVIEQYLQKAAEDKVNGLISDEMWKEETDRWTEEKERLIADLAATKNPPKAA